MFPPPKKYSALSRKQTQADRSALYEDLKEYGRFTGLCWLISPEPPVANKLPFPTIEEIIFSDEFLQARGRQQQLDCLVRRSRLQQADILNISEVTVGQRDNPAWYPGGGGGGTPIYKLYRYVPPQRVWFLRCSVLK